ncbi:hypothetical protein FL966_03655 [Caproiciproducens galactitolivorans]|uniref:Uncharacterized protein n=1 Tax=Caproiciproducens galactitolivorans TaxID=642589 RepID=A0A4Z0YFC6_9FIRM|nr:hypothetical protein [Caproiciproducens galactitolivorans]QEY34216.1 hypothetical protein FL966_03655 [Caproiciproducens galactitolivorans]TGJ78025.1 hypothetical protein CAGA_04350 [Caproiciproducens galactitolivorans]
MARIMDIRKCDREIRVNSRTVMDVQYNDEYFSMWVYKAGQERGLDLCPLSIQLDAEIAGRLVNYLNQFLKNKN